MRSSLSIAAEETILDLSSSAKAWENQETSADAMIIRICSTLEGFIDAWFEQLVVAVTRDDSFRSSFANSLIDAHIESASSGWSTRTEAVKQLTGLALRSSTQWPVVDGTIEARNALVHGLGSLTRVQLRRPLVTIRRLRVAGFDVDAGDITHRPDTLTRSVRAMIAFVTWADGELRAWSIAQGR